MSAITEEIREALFTAVNVSAVTDIATGGVYYGEAELNTEYPVLIFQKISTVPIYSYGLTTQVEDSLWMLKAYSDRDSSASADAASVNQSIIDAALTAIGQDLTLSTGDCKGVMRMGDLPEAREMLADRNIWMGGVMLRIWAQ